MTVRPKARNEDTKDTENAKDPKDPNGPLDSGITPSAIEEPASTATAATASRARGAI